MRLSLKTYKFTKNILNSILSVSLSLNKYKELLFNLIQDLIALILHISILRFVH